MDNLTPKKTVEELDKYIIGQHNAKRAVAIALRNRWRRQRLSDDLRDEVLPKNIIMIGPTGVGKTEVARRLARLTSAPFVKVEASKFTEVGYVGRDVESIVRDLVEISVNMVRTEQMEVVQERAQAHAEDKVLDLLLPGKRVVGSLSGETVEDASHEETREKLRGQLREGKLDARQVEVEVKDRQMPLGVISGAGMEDLEINLKEMLGNMMPERQKRRKVSVPEALKLLGDEEAARMIDMEKVTRQAIERAEQLGLVFLDEIDKVASKSSSQGPDVSREGVQRDLLPIVEGSTVSTKYGPVRTEHVLFIAAGAFHTAKPSDLIPELQGRFPIRVELDHLGKEEFKRILTEPNNSLTKQYSALLATEGLNVSFTDDAIDEIASISAEVNEKAENIGARRLQTVMEKLLEEISFHAPDMQDMDIKIDRDTVQQKLAEIVKDEDLSKYIL